MIPLRQVWPPEVAARYRAAGYWRGETFPGFLRQRAAERPDAVAVVGGEERWTYAGLHERADSVAAGLLALGLHPGDRVIVQLGNIPEFFSAVFGLFRAGLIPVYALPAHRLTELAHFAAKAEASAYITAARGPDGFDHRILARALLAEVPALRHVVVVENDVAFTKSTSSTDLIRGSRASGNAGAEARPAESPLAKDPRVKPVDDVGGGPEPCSRDDVCLETGSTRPSDAGPSRTTGEGPKGSGHVQALEPGEDCRVKSGDAVFEPTEFIPFHTLDGDRAILPPDPDPSSVAFLQISGGTTGLSKLIPRTHDDYIYSFRASNEICGVGPDSVFMASLPAAHNFTMSSPGHMGALYAGARVVLCPAPAPATAFALIERERVTITGLVPPLALLWSQAAATTAHDLSSLEVLLVGGAKLTPEAARRVQPALGCTLQQVFGMAEGLVNYTRLDDPDAIVLETQGRPISPDDEVLIVDDLGEPVPEGEPGHLLARGPYTIRAYHNDPTANARSFTADGFYRTGDIVRRVAGGYLVVQGRAGDHINRAGEKVSAEEMEDHLLAHPNVFDAAVVSVPDEFLGESSCAFVIPQGERPRPAALKAWIRGRGIADFKVPDRVVLVESFETTAAGKISRKELRARLRARLVAAETD